MARLKRKKNKDLYLLAQRGGRFVGNSYSGRIQKHGQTGTGLGSVVGQMVGKHIAPSAAMALGKRAVKHVGKTALKSAIALGQDVLAGKNVKAAIKRRAMSAVKHLLPGKKTGSSGSIHKKKKKTHKRKKGKKKKNMKGGRLSQLPRQTYTTIGKNKRHKNVFGE